MKIEKNKIVTVTYKLYVGEGDERELMEETSPSQPLIFAFGIGMMLPKFEENLAGKTEGDKFDFVIKCADAYGEYDEENFRDLPMNIFTDEDGKLDETVVFRGNIVPLRTSDGQVINAQVVDVKEDTVVMDFNHPLAGEDLHFIGEVLGIRDITEEDLKSMQGGCGGCGGKCGDGGCGDGGCGEGKKCGGCGSCK